MARIRTVKPDFWTDEKIVELTPWARLLFIGLWNFCDDSGRLVYSPKRIKLQIFPADDLNISELIGEIRGKSLIEVYTHENQEYLQVVNFGRHQKIDHRTASRFPPPPDSTEPHRIPSLEGKGMERKGRDKRQVASLPAWLDAKAWDEWIEYRRQIRKSLTPKTIEKQLRFLEARKADHVAIINQAIEKGWTGLFELKASHENTRGNSAPDRVRRANDKYRQ